MRVGSRGWGSKGPRRQSPGSTSGACRAFPTAGVTGRPDQPSGDTWPQWAQEARVPCGDPSCALCTVAGSPGLRVGAQLGSGRHQGPAVAGRGGAGPRLRGMGVAGGPVRGI